MSKKNLLQVFEYDKLFIDEKEFKDTHWEALAKYNEEHGSRYFTLLRNGVKFHQYVGVIQVGNLTIEILPKIDRHEEDKSKWQKILLEMLRECHWLQLHANQNASLRLKQNDILEAYLEIYLNACEVLLHESLVKKYRKEQSNQQVLKGKLVFAEHIRKNFIHKERFYTEHTVYDRNNRYNAILYKALCLLPKIATNPSLINHAHKILLGFPEVDDIAVTESSIAKLKYDRKTERYRTAIDIAAMLLLNYRPDIKGGRKSVLAILIDMNELWEEYVYRRLKKSIPSDWQIRNQHKKQFWSLKDESSTKIIRPDIVIHKNVNETIIIDTKWKIPDNDIPSDADLKQIFVYNNYWNATTGILLYPRTAEENQNLQITLGNYALIEKGEKDVKRSANVVKLSLVKNSEEGINKEGFKELVEKLKSL